ncbi:MAG: sugar phosphate nucleotidyltransferase [Verrucomicrobiae bacterium]
MFENLPLAGIDAAILVGGMGTRLRGVVDDVPKPLAPVLGRPFLYYQLDMLALRGARSVTLCCGYKAGLVRETIGSDWLGMPVNYSVESEPLGTGGALSLARQLLASPLVLVLNGDSWLEPDWADFVEAAGDSRAEVSLALVEVPDSGRFGTVGIEDGLVIDFKEKSASRQAGLINGGVYLVSQDVLGTLQEGPCSLEKDIFPALALERRLRGMVAQSPFLDIGVPGDYAAAGNFFSALGIAPHTMFPDMPSMDQAQPKLGTCAVIFDESGRVLLEQRSDCGWWCLPAGRLDAGETLTQGAVREAREETGLDIEISGFLGMFSDPKRRTVRYPDNGDLRQLVDAAVFALPAGGKLTASPESLDLRWFAPNELPLNTVPPVVEILRVAFRHEGSPVLR